MSSSGKHLSVESWLDILHDLKNNLGNARNTLEQIPHTDETSFAELLGTLIALHQDILKHLHDATDKEATPEEQSKTRVQYMTALRTALAQAQELSQALSAQGKNAQIEEDINDLIDELKDAQTLLDPTLQASSSLERLANRKVSSYNKGKFRQNHNTASFKFIPPELGTLVVKADYVNFIRSIIVNCLDNASAVLEKDLGHVEIEVRSADSGETLEIVIKDNGPGMPDRILKGLQQGIKGTTGTAGGHGIGLSGLHASITGLKGSMQVESSRDPKNHGTQFTWKLPQKLISTLDRSRTPSPTLSATTNLSIDTRIASPEAEIKVLGPKPIIYLIDDNAMTTKLANRTAERLLKKLKCEALVSVKAINYPTEKLPSLEDPNIIGVIVDKNLGAGEHSDSRYADGVMIAHALRETFKDKICICLNSGDAVTAENMAEYKINSSIAKGESLEKALKVFLELAFNNSNIPISWPDYVSPLTPASTMGSSTPRNFGSMRPSADVATINAALQRLAVSPDKIADQLGERPPELTPVSAELKNSPNKNEKVVIAPSVTSVKTVK